MRFTKAFQLIALALTISVFQVYVMAGPIKALNDPRTTDGSVKSLPRETATATETVVTEATDSQLPTAQVAAERMPLTASSKTTLGRIFSKGNLEARAASGTSFLKASVSAADTFKAPTKAAATAQKTGSNDDSDSGGGGSRGTWIAVGVIAAVLTIAVIGLRHDRTHTPGPGN